ncbi:MAG: 6-phosphofructokinase [Anaerolineaceae bacterium]|jgi:6-phosphofructokinase 1
MSPKKISTIGVMTSGGDAPGMNPCIRAVVRTAVANQLRVLGIEDGYDGLIAGRCRPLGIRDVGGILQRGGTILHTSSSEEFRSERGQQKAVRELNNAGIDALVVIGGDGSLSGASKLAERGILVIGIPASIDNDIYGTDMCIGVDTALNTIVDAIDKIRDTATSHNRAFLVETMGRMSGYLAVQAGIVTGAEMILIPEVVTPVEDVLKVIETAYIKGKTHCIIVVAEGALPHTTELAAAIDHMELGFNTRVTILGHVQRGGKPTAFDRMLASRFGSKAVEFLLAGQSNVMIGLAGNAIYSVPIHEVVSKQRILPMDIYEMGRILSQ